MSRFPIIDSPCPFRFASRPQPGRDHCGHCDRQVHNLDGMSNSQREAFMRSCQGKVCVAYTVQRKVARRSVSLGIGLAATMIGSTAMAGELISDTSTSAPNTPVSTSVTDDLGTSTLPHIEVLGGVVNPGEARWTDESEISPTDSSELPEIGEMDWLPSKPKP